jgi:hypothetical protein
VAQNACCSLHSKRDNVLERRHDDPNAPHNEPHDPAVEPAKHIPVVAPIEAPKDVPKPPHEGPMDDSNPLYKAMSQPPVGEVVPPHEGPMDNSNPAHVSMMQAQGPLSSGSPGLPLFPTAAVLVGSPA